VCTATRSHALPDLPTVSEFLPGYESSGYFGFGAPARTPAGIVDKLNKEINAGLADPKLKTQFVDLGGIILGGSSADFRTLITEETEKVGQGDPGGQHQARVARPPADVPQRPLSEPHHRP
jgi:tripartite-type tricarboxylate transporter receptor subunit TctC